MRSCHFCTRWFKNQQAIRRHLGYCRDYQAAESAEVGTVRVALMQCATCVEIHGGAFVPKVSEEEMHAASSHFGGCPDCGFNLWRHAGSKRVPSA